MDDAGFGRIRSKGDQALFGGRSTQEMKEKLGVSDKRPLADFLPTLTIAAKNLATEMTNYNVEEKDLKGEGAITTEHVQNNTTVREMLGTRGIKPEELPPSEDIKKLERKVKSQEKRIAKESGVLPKKIEEVICGFDSREDANRIVEKYSNPHIYDSPYASLECGVLRVEELNMTQPAREDMWWLD